MTAPAIARVCVDSPLPHLDRLFDYAIPDRLADVVEVGSRVRVPFAGRLISAIVVERSATSEFEGELAAIRSSSARPTVTFAGIALAQEIAARYGGSLWDVLRLMVPPRVAAVEKRDWDRPVARIEADAETARTSPDHASGPASANPPAAVPSVNAGDHVVWHALPQPGDPATVPADHVASMTLEYSRGHPSGTVLVVVPDARAIAAVARALDTRGLERWTARIDGDYAVLDHDDGPSVRYGSYLAAMHGHVRIVVGTRPVAMQPVPQLGLIVVWDDAAPAYEDPHAPYPHARTVAAMRADAESAAIVQGSYAPSVEAMALVAHGWARLVEPSRADVRVSTPAVDVLTDERRDREGGAGWHWMPGSAWRALTSAVEHGPVAVVVPRAGYVTSLACARCGTWAACRECEGSLELRSSHASLVCRDCGTLQPDWHCPACSSGTTKHVRAGVDSIAEQLQRMANNRAVHVSSAASGVVPDGEVDGGIVVATPGAVPAVPGGYAHMVIIGADTPARGGVGADAHAVRWWLGAASLVRPRGSGGAVTLVGELPDPVRRAIQSWDPVGFAREAAEERTALGLPPARRILAISGDAGAVAEVLDARVGAAALGRRDDVSVLVREDRTVVLVPRALAGEAIARVRAIQVERSAAGSAPVRLRVDAISDLAG